MIRILLGSIVIGSLCLALSACSDEPDISANPQLKNPREAPTEKVQAPGTDIGGFTEKKSEGAAPAPKGTSGN
jgi:hypothetical protein